MATTMATPADQVSTAPTRGSQRRRRPRTRNPDTQTQQAHDENQAPTLAQAPTRGGRRGRGRGSAAGQNSSNESGDAAAEAPGGSRRGNRGRGGSQGQQRGRGGFQGPQRGRGGYRAGPGGRQFGGQLTETTDILASNTPSTELQADAPVFQPGQPLTTRLPPKPKMQRPQAPKSSAPDIATRTHEDIDNGHYDCAICYDTLKRKSKAWSCRTCWSVFHLHCIKSWSGKEGAAAARQQAENGDSPPPRQWRCPGCNLPKDDLPRNFTCWCEKETDPKPLPGLPPFSCGQTCARPRVLPKKCPHPCPSTCHAGPCPPCAQMGPTQYCFCGKNSITRRCVDTDYENGWSCGEVCGELMACGEHYCPEPCHEGLCGACEVRFPARCYCGQVQKDLLCCDRGDELESSQSHIAADGSVAVEHWTGLFECTNKCGRLFDCGKHRCEKPCHQQDAETPHCPRSPDIVTRCPCGKTRLSEISDKVRKNCEDPIPNCSKPCRKRLDCGHECQKTCHQGECPPCLQKMPITCRCGRITSTTICHQGHVEQPQCMRVCKVFLNCGRHECGERCCPGEKKAAERQKKTRKQRPIDSAPVRREDEFEAEHICTRSCGRPLKCGNPDHRCEELCHKGACGTCREAIFHELSCHCGRTVIQPPLPCGTQPPPCRFNCERPKACGHPQVSHNCHQDDESCPKCPFLVTKTCLCGKDQIKNQPCWFTEVRCGQVCGRKLKCGAHTCQKQCHRPGECEDPCRQPCGKELSICGHPCTSPCHSPASCKEDKACQYKILVTCECQRIKQEAKCNASKNSTGNLNKTLKCDDECARLERNRKLALALNIDPATHQDDHIPYSTDTLRMYQENISWGATQEKTFRTFAADPEEKRLRFKPMPRNQRAFIHSLAEDFGFDSESMDPEPHRHVVVFKTPKFVLAPMKTLAECSRIRPVQRVAAPTTTVPVRPKQNAMSADPYNGFIIVTPRFALTVEEVSAVLKNTLPKTSFPVELDINFLPSEEVALKPPLMTRLNMPEPDLQARLESIKPALAAAVSAQGLGKLQLARLDASLNVLRRESDGGGSGGAGWSQVVASKGAPMRRLQHGAPVAAKESRFAVLSLSSTKKKKEKEKQVEVVDDWEAAELEEEEKEKDMVESEKTSGSGSSAASAGPSSPVEADGLAQTGDVVVVDVPVEKDVGVETEKEKEKEKEKEFHIATKPGGLRWEDEE